MTGFDPASFPPPAAREPVLTVPAPEADGDWHRLHPVTPLIRGWKLLAVALVLVVQQRSDDVFSGNGLPGALELLITAGVLLLAAVVSAGYAWLSWRMARYRVALDAVHLHTGVLFRQQRQARLDRLQAVDVVQPLLARMLGLSELKLEVAGGSGSDVRLAYLREGDAQRLRNTLLARAAGLGYDTPEAPEAPQRELVVVPTDRLLLSLLRSGTTVAIGVALVGLVVALMVFRQPGVLIGAGPAALGLVSAHWARFSRGFAFRVAVSPDGVRLRHGLLESRSQTVPPGRVQAVRISQPLLWRGPDWWRVEINVAGYGAGADGSLNETVLLPVGTRGEALQVLSLVLPDLGVEGLGIGTPADVLVAGLTGTDTSAGFTCAPPASRWVDPVGWRRNGFTVTRRALLARRGRLTRELDVVPHERTQSLGLSQGPLQRRLGVASMVVHSTPGPVSPAVAHLEAGTAARLLAEQAERARQARSQAGPERWMSGDLEA